MGLIFYAGRTAVRSAARNSGKPAVSSQDKRYGPVGVCVVLLVTAGIAVAYPWFRVLLAVCGGLVVLGVLVGVVYGVIHRNDIRKPAASDVDKVLDDLLGDKTGSGKP
jgi:hypothetical protein